MSPKLLITSCMKLTIYHWLNKVYSFCMAAMVNIGSRCGLIIEVHHRNQPNMSKLSHYFHFLIVILNSCTQATRWSTSVILCTIKLDLATNRVSRLLESTPQTTICFADDNLNCNLCYTHSYSLLVSITHFV